MKYWNSVIKLFFIAFVVTTVTSQMLFVGVSYGQAFQLSHKLKRDAINFKLVKNFVVISVYINDKGPFNFILDTGVDHLIITDSSIVDKSQLTNLRRVKINGTG